MAAAAAVDPRGAAASGTPDNARAPSSLAAEICSLAQTLQQAIRFGKEDQAKQVAAQLAQKNAALNVDVCFDKPVHSGVDEEIRVKVYVEDKDSSGVCVVLKLNPSMTIRQLKSKMLVEYSFPPEVQKWIVGKRIAADSDTLAKCGVKTSGTVMFLYLISPKSVGLSKQKIMLKYKHLLPQGNSSQQSLIEGATEAATAAQNEPASRTPAAANAGATRDPEVRVAEAPAAAAPRATAAAAAAKPAAKPPPPRAPPVEPEPVEEVGWACTVCTFFNVPTRPGCAMCSQPRPADYKVPEGYVIPQVELDRMAAEAEAERLAREAEEEEKDRLVAQSVLNYEHMLSVENQDMVPNMEEFECPVCFDTVQPGSGVILRECLHKFCKDCLSGQVEHADTPEVKCPYQDDDYACGASLQEREIKAIVSPEIYMKFLERSLTRAESVAQNSYHCKTPDCRGWCIYEDEANFFACPICNKSNCLTCKAIHEGMNCRQYQDDLTIRAGNDVAAKQTHETIQTMLSKGEAINCPSCNIVVQKKDGCDWVMCTMCQTEICWVTKGPRWGPMGEGDTSGGCKCGENGRRCHPNCVNCH